MVVRTPDGLRRHARRALGHFRIGLQRRRSARHLSVQGVRRARARPEARAWATSWSSRPTPRRSRRCSCRHEAPRNLRRLAALGVEGEYGFFDAVDYTNRERRAAPSGTAGRSARRVIVRTYMAHHQGMTLVALANALLDDRMVSRFHLDSRVQATELLLQERRPREVPVAQPLPLDRRAGVDDAASSAVPPLSHAAHGVPARAVSLERAVRLRGHQRRRRQPAARRPGGDAIAARRHARSGQHVPLSARRLERRRLVGRRTIRPRRAGRLPRHLPPRSRDVPASRRRRSSASSTSRCRPRTTSKCGGWRSRIRDRACARSTSPATSNWRSRCRPPTWRTRRSASCFSRPSICRTAAALLCHRRQRDASEPPIWAMHVLSLEGRTQGAIEWETDRAQLSRPRTRLARRRGPRRPHACRARRASCSIRSSVFASASGSRRARRCDCHCATGVAADREAAQALAQKYREPSAAMRAFALALGHAQSALHHLAISGDDALLFERLASRVLYADGSLRAPRRGARDESARSGRSVAAQHLGRSADSAGPCRRRGRAVAGAAGPAGAGVLAAERAAGRRGHHQRAAGRLSGRNADAADGAARRGPVARLAAAAGGRVSAARRQPSRSAERTLLEAVARAVLSGDRGDLQAQLDRPYADMDPRFAAGVAGRLESATPSRGDRSGDDRCRCRRSSFANGLGGFADDGRDVCRRARGRAGDAARHGRTSSRTPASARS